MLRKSTIEVFSVPFARCVSKQTLLFARALSRHFAIRTLRNKTMKADKSNFDETLPSQGKSFPALPCRNSPRISQSQSQDAYKRELIPSAFHFKNHRSRGMYCHLFILHMVFVPYMGLSSHIFFFFFKQDGNNSHFSIRREKLARKHEPA